MKTNWLTLVAIAGAVWIIFVRRDDLGSTLWEDWTRKEGEMR